MSRRAVNVPRHMTKKLNMMTQMARNKDPQRSGAIALEAANLSCEVQGGRGWERGYKSSTRVAHDDPDLTGACGGSTTAANRVCIGATPPA